MISFLASVAITLTCILIAWFQNAIRDLPGHPVDLLTKDKLCRLILKRKYNTALSSKRLREAFENLILAFSDQQLVTGLAILIAAYCKGDITIYSFQVASALAWFSSTIHLATLVVLRVLVVLIRVHSPKPFVLTESQIPAATQACQKFPACAYASNCGSSSCEHNTK